MCRCVASIAAAPSSWRSAPAAQLRHLANMTPGQFSSFHGSHMMLPSIYVSRAKPNLKAPMRMPPLMSFFGVGAPEALLVGVVALVVFGPKGLADAAKSIGTTLRAFQPTIKEVVEVSQDIKGTLERELGLDELREAARVQPRARVPEADMDDLVRSTTNSAGFASSSFDDPDIEAKRKASAAAAWGNQTSVQQPSSPMVSNVPDTLTQPATVSPPAAAAVPPAASLGNLSMEELEAELARRKAGKSEEAVKKV